MSVRSRLEAVANMKSDAKESPAIPRVVSSLVAGNPPTASTREREERKASQSVDDPVVKLDPRQHPGLTTVVQYPSSVRQRLNRQAEQEQKASVTKSDDSSFEIARKQYRKLLQDEQRLNAEAGIWG